MEWVWIAVVAVPMALALLIPLGGSARRAAITLAPAGALPALGVSLTIGAHETATVTWLVLGTSLGMDQPGQLFLLLTSVLWLMSGVYARAYHAADGHRHRFFFFFLLTMSGNLGLVIAQDVISFYAAFALMTFSAYGLVVHHRSARALRAGKVYIVLAVIGEAFLLTGLVLAVFAGGAIDVELVRLGLAQSDYRDLAVGSLLVGFGIKAGAIPLHVWLPLAHPVAPTPASAVLSGAMIKAGLLGWIRFLPIGDISLPGWATLLIAISLGAAFLGVLIGLTQNDPKTLLAYSSISQMGFITSVVAIGLAEPDAWPVAVTGCGIYVLHHGLIKGALFLGVGVAHTTGDSLRKARLVMGGLTIAALALAGAPLSTGALAKTVLKEGVYLGPTAWAGLLDWLLPVAAVGTTVLMGRFLWLIWWQDIGHEEDRPVSFAGLVTPWLLLVVAGFAIVWGVPSYYELPVSAMLAFERDNLVTSIWPLVVGIAILFAIWLAVARTRAEIAPLRIPAGDLLIPIEWVLNKTRPESLPDEIVPHPRDPVEGLSASWYGLFMRSHPNDRTSQLSKLLVNWSVAGILFAGVAILMMTLMLWG